MIEARNWAVITRKWVCRFQRSELGPVWSQQPSR